MEIPRLTTQRVGKTRDGHRGHVLIDRHVIVTRMSRRQRSRLHDCSLQRVIRQTSFTISRLLEPCKAYLNNITVQDATTSHIQSACKILTILSFSVTLRLKSANVIFFYFSLEHLNFIFVFFFKSFLYRQDPTEG